MQRFEKPGFVSAMAIFLGTISGIAQENLTEWTHNKNISINTKTTGTGANVLTNQTNYPLLVRLDSVNASDIFNAALTGGVDIRFSKPSGTRLRFQRERWDAVARRAEFWVLMDTVKGNDSAIALRIHWGKAGAPDSSRGSSVFSAANGFIAVWHMNETVAVAGDSIKDATATGRKGTLGLEGTGAPIPANITTGIGIGKNFAGAFEPGTVINTGAFFLLSNADSALNLNTNTGPFTISAWASPAVCDGTARITILSKYLNQEANTQGRAFSLHTANATGNWALTMDPLAFASASTTSVTTEYVADGPCDQNVWTYVAGRYNSNGNPPTPDATGAENTKMWINNSASGIGFTANHQPASVGNSSNVYIGRLHNVERFMRGGVDEVRVSNVERTDDWLRLDYATQRPGAVAVTVGPVPVVAIASGAANASRASIVAMGSSVRFLLPEGMTGAKVSIVDLSGREVWSSVTAAGVRELVWNGAASTGNRAPPGGYVARVSLPRDGSNREVVTESRVVLLR
jgi:hypothetical protein